MSLSTFVSGIDAPSDVPRGSTLFASQGALANMPVLRGFRMFNGYAAMMPLTAYDPNSLIARRIGGVEWQQDASGWHSAAAPMARARLVTDVRQSADIQAIDIGQTAIIPRFIGEFAGHPGDAQVLVDRPGRMSVGVKNIDSRQLLVLTERFHRGWRAVIDGHVGQTVNVYGDRLGVVIEPKAQMVSLEFSPTSVRVGSAATICGAAILTMACSWSYLPVNRRRLRQSPA
jgi:hypothetical protein